MQALLDHRWPGNVRELDHAIERSVLMAQQELVRPSDLAIRVPKEGSQQEMDRMSIEEVEALLIKKALSRFSGNVTQAAEALGLSRGALYRRLEKYGLA